MAGTRPINPKTTAVATQHHGNAEKKIAIQPTTKRTGNSDNGTAASVVGNIVNGLSADEIDMGNPPYVSLKRQHEHEYTVTASPDGELWLLVGTDSGFEGLTGIYYQRIVVTLKPVK
jgi:hypothetical protein